MVRKLILEKLAARRLTMKAASLEIGRAHSFLYQFLKTGVPRELFEKDRIKLAALLEVSEDQLRGPSSPLPKRSYEKNVMTPVKSTIDRTTREAYPDRLSHPADIVPAADLFGTRIDLPVHGTAAASGMQDGCAIVTQHAVDWTVRPPSLLRVQDGYGLIVPDDTMSPEHRVGSICLVNPHLPPKIGESCVLRCVDESGTVHAMIREYRGETDTHWKLAQHNPPKSSTVKKSTWTCQKTVGNYSA